MRHIDGIHAKQALKVAKVIALAIAAFALILAMTGCASIPRRAWDNGANISSSRAYRSMMSGDRSFRTMRELYSSMDPYRSRYQARPYQPFGRW